MTFDPLIIFRVIGLFLAAGIGIFRLIKNHLYGFEKNIYLLLVFSLLWFAFVYLFSCCGPLADLEAHTLRNQLIRIGWQFMVVSQILVMLYYRRFPRR